MPGNEGRGYVIRRILRRAVRYGYQYLNLREPFLYRLVDPLRKKMGDFFPELSEKQNFIEKVVRGEEDGFLRTLETGLTLFDRFVQEAGDQKSVPGDVAFQLHDTYGFPIDLTQLMARELGFSVDMAGYERLMQEQRDRARAASSFKSVHIVTSADEDELHLPETAFVGYETTRIDNAVIVHTQTDDSGDKPRHQIVLDRTPFYAEKWWPDWRYRYFKGAGRRHSGTGHTETRWRVLPHHRPAACSILRR